jgi:hypothetical protein
MGEVYKARDTRLDCTVAVKICVRRNQQDTLVALRIRCGKLAPLACHLAESRDGMLRSSLSSLFFASSLSRLL